MIAGFYTDWNRPNCGGRYGGVGWYRIVNPLGKLGAKIVGKFTIGGAETALKMKEMGDIWFMKPTDSKDVDFLIGTAKEFTGCKLILDLDDDPFNVDPEHPQYKEIMGKMKPIENLIRMADHIVVSTEPLEHSVEKYNPKITVIPNAIDPEIWKVKKKKHRRLRIGWIASASHMADIPVILPAMKKILAKYDVEFHIAGIIAEDIKSDRVFHHIGTKGYDEYPQFLADLGLDIALAPIKDTQFNRCKSNIKWLENAMLETPVVASKVYPYEFSIKKGTGYLAEGTNQWVKYLSWLIESKELREKVGKAAKKEVLTNWTIDKQLPKYKELFKSMEKKDITVYTAITDGKNDLIEEQNTDGANFVCFTDKPVKSKTWEIKKVCDKFKDPVMNAKIHKVLPHKYFDTPWTIWIDGTVQLKDSPKELVEKLGHKPIVAFRHIGRDCIYDEAEACKLIRRGDPKEINEQVKLYAKDGHQKHAGMVECGFLIRENTLRINEKMEAWWADICRYSVRDQLSFPVAVGFDEVNQIERGEWDYDHIKYVNHKK